MTSTTSNSTSTLFVLAKSNASISLTRGPVNLELIIIWTFLSASKLQIVKLILISIKFQLKTTYYHVFRHRILEAEDKVYLSINIIGEKYQQRANLTIFFSICCNVNATRLWYDWQWWELWVWFFDFCRMWMHRRFCQRGLRLSRGLVPLSPPVYTAWEISINFDCI